MTLELKTDGDGPFFEADEPDGPTDLLASKLRGGALCCIVFVLLLVVVVVVVVVAGGDKLLVELDSKCVLELGVV